MNGYISRQTAIEALIERDASCGIDSAEVIKELPAADVIEVVRCRNCVWMMIKGDGLTHWYHCLREMKGVNLSDYCSRGKKKEWKIISAERHWK